MANAPHSDATLPSPEELETPPPREKPKGLVKRAGFVWALVALLIFLIIMFIRDVTSDGPRRGADSADQAKVGSAERPASAANYQRPQIDEIDEAALAAAVAASKAAAAQPVQPALPQVSGPTQPHPGAPTPSARAPMLGAPVASPELADHEQAATANASPMGFLDVQSDGGGTGAVGAPTQVGRPGQAVNASGIPSFEDAVAATSAQMRAQAEEDSKKQQEMIRTLMSGAAAGQRPVIGHRTQADREFLKSFSDTAAAQNDPGGKTAEGFQAARLQLPTQLPSTIPVILQGARIPVVAMEAVNSDMPGTLSARVTADVFDSITQTHLLVPRGTRLDLRYSSEVRPGQTRVLLASSRLVRPDGLIVDLGGAQGVDALGRAGIEGNVNNHFIKMFGYSLATAIISVKVPNDGLTTTSESNGKTSTGTVAGEVLADVSRRILARNADIPPTITLPVGVKFHVVITRDIGLPVYAPGR